MKWKGPGFLRHCGPRVIFLHRGTTVSEKRVSLDAANRGVLLETGIYHTLVVERPLQVEIYLHDALRQPLPGAPFELICDDKSHPGKADGDAKASVTIDTLSDRCTMRWSADPNAAPEDYEYEREIFLEFGGPNTVQGRERRLHNLGLPSLDDVSEAMRMFRSWWGVDAASSASELERRAQEPIAHEQEDDGEDDPGERT
jgi:hypothetical protein